MLFNFTDFVDDRGPSDIKAETHTGRQWFTANGFRILIRKVNVQGFQSGPVPGTFTRLRSCIVPAEITEPSKISGGQNHKYDGR